MKTYCEMFLRVKKIVQKIDSKI